MVTLEKDVLVFRFPEVFPGAVLRVSFLRMPRLPEENMVYRFPRSSIRFPLVHVDDYKNAIDPEWIKHGGVMLPMYQGEAVKIFFSSDDITGRKMPCPFAVKTGCGKINAVTGELFDNGIKTGPEQNYISVMNEQNLYGYHGADGKARQFTAMPLGEGFTAEELLTGKASYGGIQIMVYPMLREAYESYFPYNDKYPQKNSVLFQLGPDSGMGLAPGDYIKQKLFRDSFKIEEWDTHNTSRCFIHILNSIEWQDITGKPVPHEMPAQISFKYNNIPWHENYHDKKYRPENNSMPGFIKSVFKKNELEKQRSLLLSDMENEKEFPDDVY